LPRQHSTLSSTLHSIICLFIEDNWRCLLVGVLFAVEWTCAATTRIYCELTGCVSICGNWDAGNSCRWEGGKWT
jgi:hypothetical protein